MIEAIIPCRGGSTRVPRKNIRPFADSSLLAIKIEQLLRVDLFDVVTVNSDADEMLDLARSLGAQAVRREEGLCDGDTLASAFYLGLVRQSVREHIAMANCTNPLLRDETIARCVTMYRDTQPTSVNTARLFREFLFDDQSRPCNFDPRAQVRSQDLPAWRTPTFAFQLAHRDTVQQHANWLTPTPTWVLTDEIESVDIDTPLDFVHAEWLYRHVTCTSI